jgi:hypothetical protein
VNDHFHDASAHLPAAFGCRVECAPADPENASRKSEPGIQVRERERRTKSDAGEPGSTGLR